MSIAFDTASVVLNSSESILLSQQMTLSGQFGSAYLVLNGYDRNEYVAGADGTTGSFAGGGHTLGFSALGGDARGAGIVFNYIASSGRFSNATYGFLDQLTYTASTSLGDVTHLSLFGTNNLYVATRYASNAISLAQHDASGYLGSLTVATIPGFSDPVPTQATPFSIAATAQTFVGAACNRNGCWVLASTISAEAGASLPVQSAVNMAGAANGEWSIAYDGISGSRDDWAASVRTGDMIGFITAAGTGHITTCVSGVGSTAKLIDNITIVDAQGNILNGANDGSANDIIVQAAHTASQEWAGVSASSVVIFRLDTPVVTTQMTTLNVAAGATANLADIFAASDPVGKAMTTFQAYTTTSTDSFTVGGTSTVATSAATAVSADSLSKITFNRGSLTISDDVTVRAYNGTYWGDWTTISLNPIPASVTSPPVMSPTVVSSPVISPTMSSPDISSTSVNTGPGMSAPPSTRSDQVAIHRFFDKNDGTHFFTASATEAASLEAERSDLSYEGVGLHGYDVPDATASSQAVFRFFDLADGTHFYTASTDERDSLLTSPSSGMKYEGVAFYEDSAPQAGDTAVFRFFDTIHGTHLFTQSAGERASILSTRTDLVAEGIAFYAPT